LRYRTGARAAARDPKPLKRLEADLKKLLAGAGEAKNPLIEL
jgi:hypothetical protein